MRRFAFTCLLLSWLATAVADAPSRIVSLAPSITETLFALDLGEHVVGVTRYCDYPETTKDLPKVGGYVDPNYEVIVALHPDLVILQNTHQDAIDALKKLGIETFAVPHATIADIHHAIKKIGQRCGAPEKAETLLENLEKRQAAIAEKVRGLKRPRVMLCIGRDSQSDDLSGLYIAGQNDFYQDIIELAGGRNAWQGKAIAFPQISAEGIIQINPDVIIDMASHFQSGDASQETIVRQWDILKVVKAVRENRVYAVTGRHTQRPGPRYIRFLEEVARLLHPGAFPSEPQDD